MEKRNSDELHSKTLKINTQVVRYHVQAHGFLASPKKKGDYPGVLVVHDHWGLNENIKEMVGEISKRGYNVLAIDLFHGQVTADIERAAKLVKSVKQKEVLNNMQAGLAYLRTELAVEKIASCGLGFGAVQSLQLAIFGEKLDGTIIYHGIIAMDKTTISKIAWPVLGFFGDQDEFVSIDIVKDFEKKLQTRHIENEIYTYRGVSHDFVDPASPGYSPKEADEALEKTLAFLSRNLKHYRRVRIKIA